MSELTQCNHCKLKQIKRQAKEHKKRVIMQPSTQKILTGGTDVLVVPIGVTPDREKHFVAWFWSLSKYCVC